jgi:Neuraminidase (sialidase)
LNWCDQRNGKTDTDVWLSKSTDAGITWSDPIRVNQDSSKNHQFFTWMTVDPSTGNLYFVYYDRRNYNDTRTDVYVSCSTDGGNSFHDTRISDSPFVPFGEVFFGDYLNIAAVDGVIRPIWPRMDNGNTSLWVTLIDEKELLKSIGK